MMPAPVIDKGFRLSHLLDPWVQLAEADDVAVTSMTLDSRAVEPGGLFVALDGLHAHGLAYVEQAIALRAAAVIWEPSPTLDPSAAERLCEAAGVACVMVPQLHVVLGEMASRFYGEPSHDMAVIGITGTDGKTSCSQFIAQALSGLAHHCGVLGTLGYGMYGSEVPGGHTTPDAIRVQRFLADMRDLGASHVSMEVSSHALVQGRVSGTRYDVAVLTNVTRDHLDYHGSEEAYRDAKTRLFQMPGLGHAVLNMDDSLGRQLAERLDVSVDLIRYSIDPQVRGEVDFHVTRIQPSLQGLTLDMRTPAGEVTVKVPVIGRFNAANIAATLATLHALGVNHDKAVAMLESLRPVPGRMERFGGPGQPTVIIDYAHTPGALQSAIRACREHAAGRLWVVFGCGGDRDTGKRPAMGEVADRLADEVVLTDDNPRSESGDAIIEDILGGFSRLEPFIQRDRAEAIALAIENAHPMDVVLIAGKGHESVQEVAGERLPFSDQAAAKTVLKEVRWC